MFVSVRCTTVEFFRQFVCVLAFCCFWNSAIVRFSRCATDGAPQHCNWRKTLHPIWCFLDSIKFVQLERKNKTISEMKMRIKRDSPCLVLRFMPLGKWKRSYNRLTYCFSCATPFHFQFDVLFLCNNKKQL